jgi:hypothetical protein
MCVDMIVGHVTPLEWLSATPLSASALPDRRVFYFGVYLVFGSEFLVLDVLLCHVLIAER